jgi:hypothetical protein
MVRRHFIRQVLGHLEVFHVPAVLGREAAEGLGAREAEVVAVRAREVQLLRLGEERFVLQDAHDARLSGEKIISRKQMV